MLHDRDWYVCDECEWPMWRKLKTDGPTACEKCHVRTIRVALYEEIPHLILRRREWWLSENDRRFLKTTRIAPEMKS